jgi:hypothetical protein
LEKTMNKIAMIASVVLVSGGMVGPAAAQQPTNPSQSKPSPQYDSSGAPVQPEPGKPNAASPVPTNETTGQAPFRDDRLQADRPTVRERALSPDEQSKPIPR